MFCAIKNLNQKLKTSIILKFSYAYLVEIFSCDLRSLALMRIGLALIILADCLNRFINFIPFHSEDGLFPRSILLSHYGNPYIWSFNHMATGDWWPALLLVLKTIFALALLFAYRSRFAIIASWALELSFQAKSPLIGQGGDVLLRMLLFWGMFLPLNARWGADCRNQISEKSKILSMATVGYILQIVFLYIFSVLLKTGDAWRKDGSAVYFALNLDHFATSIGKTILNLPYEYLQFASFFVLAIEFVIPILFFLPKIQNRIRFPLILILWIMHLGFGSSLAIGNFVAICIVATMGMLPASFWELLNKFFVYQFLLANVKNKINSAKINLTIYFREVILALIIVYILLWNLGQLKNPVTRFAQRRSEIAMLLRIDQNWGMFAPFPMTDDGWFVIKAELRNKKIVNLMNPDAEISFEKPVSIKDTYADFRWRKYMINIYLAENSEYRRPFSRYLCKQWNALHSFEEQLITFNIYYMRENTPPPGKPLPVPEQLDLWNWRCFS
jgi:hypothetical protein